ncbi:MAG: histidine phosphatase family protein [Acidisphaera sp.]|nr:histidine phosphatase family protein [Acidisphaera sp.]MBV9811330.1 histidine phosphatase family protein [Acetobacteraceae bacterium]
MSTLTILIIRHGEKPDPDDPTLGDGLTQAGAPNKHSLVVRGWQRAGSWAALFGPGNASADYPVPDAVFAANPCASPDPSDADASLSKRPWQTILPLCGRLRITPVTQYGVGDENPMLDAVRTLTGTVLICWEHKRIAEVILPELARGQTLPQLPARWRSERFDVVLRFDRAQSSAGWRFRQMFPRLLSGDSDTPLPTQ